MNIRENLKAFLDGELTPQEQAEVQKALDQNPQLSQELEELKMISKSIKESAKEIPIQGYENLKSRFQPKSTLKKLILPIAGLAILSAVLFPIFFNANSMTESSPAAAGAEAASEVMTMEPPGSAMPAEEMDLRSKSTNQEAAGSASNYNDDSTSPPLASIQSRQRDIIKTGDISVQVDDLNAANTEVVAIAKKYQGYVEANNYSNPTYPNAVRTASLTIRVSANNFDQAIKEIGSLGNLQYSSSNGQDVTAQIVDSTARLKAMRAEEDQYIEILRATKNVNEILAVKERLNRVRQEIESLDAQLKNLKDLASLSTITVQLQEKPTIQPSQPTDWASQTVTNATKTLQRIGQFVAKAGIYIAILSPLWLPIAILIWWRIKKSKSK